MKTMTMSPSDSYRLIEALSKMDFFADLGAADLSYVTQYVQYCSFKPGTTLVRQGARPDSLYILAEGEAVVKTKKWFFMPSIILRYLGPGEFFGEMALVRGGPRTASVQAKTEIKVFVLHQKQVEAMLENNTPFRHKLFRMAEQRRIRNSLN